MSYICLLAAQDFAVIAGDTRITIDTLIPGFYLHHDHGCKVFSSDHGKTIWGCTGLTRTGFLNYPSLVRNIMRKDDIPLETRLCQVETLMRKHTKAPFFFRIPALKKIPGVSVLLSSMKDKNGYTFNLIWADTSASDRGEPAFSADHTDNSRIRAGSVCVQNGHVAGHHIYHTPVFVENGMNRTLLTSSHKYRPKANSKIPEMQKAAVCRVRESIQKDQEMRQKNPHYTATVGGRVLVKTLQ